MSSQELAAAFAEAQQQIQAQAQQQLADKMLKTCFERCVTKVDERLSDKQRRCLDQCTGAFLEGFAVASETMNAIIKKQASSMAHE